MNEWINLFTHHNHSDVKNRSSCLSRNEYITNTTCQKEKEKKEKGKCKLALIWQNEVNYCVIVGLLMFTFSLQKYNFCFTYVWSIRDMANFVVSLYVYSSLITVCLPGMQSIKVKTMFFRLLCCYGSEWGSGSFSQMHSPVTQKMNQVGREREGLRYLSCWSWWFRGRQFGLDLEAEVMAP